MSLQDRNPSPPVNELSDVDEGILHADTIGDTVFSKRWVFATLMKLLKEVEKEPAGKSAVELNQAAAHGVDIEENLESDLCKLWDMTANQDVANFLHEWKTLDILTSVIEQTSAPRLTEICMGILANMACSKKVTVHLSGNEKVRSLTMELMGSSDTQTLIQSSRLLLTCLSSKEDNAVSDWLAKITAEFCQKVAFILKSSTNCELLYNIGFIMRTLLELDEALVHDWTDTEQIVSLVEALKQVSSGGKLTAGQSRTISLLLGCLEIIIADDDGMTNLVSASDTVLPLLTDFLWSFCEDEVVSVSRSEGSLASAIYIIEVVMANMEGANDIVDTLLKYPKLLKGAVEIFASLYTQKVLTEKQRSHSQSMDNPANINRSSEVGGSSKLPGDTKLDQTRTPPKTNFDFDDKQSSNKHGENSSSNADDKVPRNSCNVSKPNIAPTVEDAAKGITGSNVFTQGGDESDEEEDRDEERKELSDNLSSFFVFLLREAGGSTSQSQVAGLLIDACGDKHLSVLREGMATARASPEIQQLLQQHLMKT